MILALLSEEVDLSDEPMELSFYVKLDCLTMLTLAPKLDSPLSCLQSLLSLQLLKLFFRVWTSVRGPPIWACAWLGE